MSNEWNRDRKKYYFVFDNNKLLVKNNNGINEIPVYDDLKKSFSGEISPRDFGSLNGCTCYCLNKPKDYIPGDNMTFQELRQLGSIFDEELFHISCRGLHLLRWYENNKYCSKCGALAEDKKDERAKICPVCGFINYPRISPAIIVAIVNKDKLLLAHNSRFADGLYSVIAGFVEPGEAFEKCVFREVKEEIGIEVENIKYFGSQPWPFPDSIMVGFTAEYAGGEIREDGIEIIHADWYGVNELPNTPKGGSIAAKLIKWFIENHSGV